jgi:hypothetical protein
MALTKRNGLAAVLLAVAALIVAPATVVTVAPPAFADCGDPGEAPCTGPVPTTDEVDAIMSKLTDPSIPAANKGDIVTPGFTPEEAGEIDDHLNNMNSRGYLPLNFVVTDIQPAPSNFAGATLAATGPIPIYLHTAPEPIVLTDQDGRWLITHETAMAAIDAFWHSANRRIVVPVVP